MIKLKKQNKRAQEEEEKKQEEEAATGGSQPNEVKKSKKSPGELRIQKEIQELDIPTHATIKYPKPGDIMNFNLIVDLSHE